MPPLDRRVRRTGFGREHPASEASKPNIKQSKGGWKMTTSSCWMSVTLLAAGLTCSIERAQAGEVAEEKGKTNVPAAGPPASQPGDVNWVPIGKNAYKDMKDPKFSADKMGGTTIFVDRTTGDVFLSMWRNGVWKSSDAGKTFARIDGGKISNAQGGPAGGRGVYMDLEGRG
jgi:hypothetical protein